MKPDNVVQLPGPDATSTRRSILDEIVREGARKMLQVLSIAPVDGISRSHIDGHHRHG